MRNTRPTQPNAAPTVFALPEKAHLGLIQMRDHLRLLAQLTETGTSASKHDAIFRPDALAWWFTRLSRDLDAIVAATYWTEAVANTKAPKPREN